MVLNKYGATCARVVRICLVILRQAESKVTTWQSQGKILNRDEHICGVESVLLVSSFHVYCFVLRLRRPSAAVVARGSRPKSVEQGLLQDATPDEIEADTDQRLLTVLCSGWESLRSPDSTIPQLLISLVERVHAFAFAFTANALVRA